MNFPLPKKDAAPGRRKFSENRFCLFGAARSTAKKRTLIVYINKYNQDGLNISSVFSPDTRTGCALSGKNAHDQATLHVDYDNFVKSEWES